MTARYSHPLPFSFALIEAGLRLCRVLGLKQPSFDLATLKREAESRAAHSNWGADATLFHRIELALSSIAADPHLRELGRQGFRGMVLGSAVTRLKTQAMWDAHPEISAVTLPATLVIAGMPRTGTTLLHRLLASDPAARAPLMWEMAFGETRQRAVAMATAWTQTPVRLSPKMKDIHVDGPELPAECENFFFADFAAMPFANVLWGAYGRWMQETHDFVSTYRYYKRQLQTILWQRSAGAHLVLKGATHPYNIRALLQVFPEACVIVTHRDPSEAIASTISMMINAAGPFARTVDLADAGRRGLDWFEASLRRVAEARTAAPERFVDVEYKALTSAPLDVLEEIYRRARLPLSAEARAAFVRYLERDRAEPKGRHTYTLETYGLSKADVDRRLGWYLESRAA